MVSVPLRGNGHETFSKPIREKRELYVPVPLRGNGHET